MSLGWGLRGQFGGPRGAMVPGALIALALALVARRRPGAQQVWTIAAAGALGFGIGGEDTYMQTVARITTGEATLWGYLGLLLKGGVWGGMGALFLGSALGRKRHSLTSLVIAFNVALAVSFIGYHLINEPHRIYFSGEPSHHGKAKMEAWAGLWCFYLTLLAFAVKAGDRSAVRLSLYGALGCGCGFVLGVFAFALGSSHFGAATQRWMDWWKVAECGFGLIGGLVLGWGWSRMEQEEPLTPPSSPPSMPSALAMSFLTLDLFLIFYVADTMDDLPGWVGQAPFAFLVVGLFLMIARFPVLQLLLGVTMPISLTLWNLQSYWVGEQHVIGAGISAVGLLALSALAAVATRQWRDSLLALFLLVAWTGVAISWLKMGIPMPGTWGVYVCIQGLFTVMAAWLTLVLRPRLRPMAQVVTA